MEPGAFPTFTDQAPFEARFEWGEAGVRALAPAAGTVVIVDVLSFSTAVDVAVSRGAAVCPVPWKDEQAGQIARDMNAFLAVPRRRVSPEQPYSLSPRSLAALPEGSTLVLPSPNGAALSAIAREYGVTVVAGCLRNAPAVSAFCRRQPGAIAVIAAGERWRGTGGWLRPAVEDLLGAGAILAELTGRSCSPEAAGAIAAFRDARNDLGGTIAQAASGRELIESGYGDDVELAAEWGVSATVPVLHGSWFVDDNRQERNPRAEGAHEDQSDESGGG